MATIAVVIPVYKAVDCIDELHRRLTAALAAMATTYEIIYVEDCGEDGSWEAIAALAHRDTQVKAIQFTRNFGQHRAITAGIEAADADWIVVMDCDLQDPPEYLDTLYRAAHEGDGYDVVLTRRRNRSHAPLRLIASKAWGFFGSVFSDYPVDAAIGSFSIISREIARHYVRLADQHRHYLLLLYWIGGRRRVIEIEAAPRFSGRSSYSLRRLIDHFLNGIIFQSTRVLMLSIYFGALMSLVSLVMALYFAARYMAGLVGVPGWASLICSIFFVGGTIHVSIGVIGIYLQKVFEETRKRPLYLIGKTINS